VFITDLGDLPVPAYAIGTTWRLFGSNAVVANDTGPFSMPGLFSRGALGAYFEASDLATQRQYSDGTRPVSELGQGVGLWLDQSREGAVSANMVTANATGSTGNNYDRAQLNPAAEWVGGQWYRMEGFYDGTDDTEPVIRIGDTDIIRPPRGFTGPVYFRAPVDVAPIDALWIAGAQNGQGHIEWANLTCAAVYGNHAYQGSNGQRPIARDKFLYMPDDQSLQVDFPHALGSACTVVKAVPGVGAHILTGQTITDTYSIEGNVAGVLIIDRALTNSERTGVIAWAEDQAGVQSAGRLMAVTQYNSGHYWYADIPAGRQVVSYFTHKFAGGRSKYLRPSFPWFITPAGDEEGKAVDMDRDGKVLGFNMQMNGINRSFLFNTSSKQVTLDNGTGEVLGSAIPASVFNLPYFEGNFFKGKLHLDFPEGGQLPLSMRSVDDYPDDQSMSFDPLVTSISEIDDLGPWAWGGETPNNLHIAYSPMFFGEFEDGVVPSVGINFGTSISAGIGDDSVGSTAGIGHWQRMLEMMPVQAAGMNFAVPGGKSINALNEPRVMIHYARANWATIEGVANDIGRGPGNETTAESVVATHMIRAADLRARGIKTIGVQKAIPVTGSDNEYVDEAGQTTFYGYDATGEAATYNGLIVVNTSFDFVMSAMSIRGLDFWKFLTNGTPFWITPDGVHLHPPGHIKRATEDAVTVWANISPWMAMAA
jgi:lysophospholipase L1-like esterase